ncbi:hypothetical protein [Pelagibius sp.]|uniref:anti-sigma factor n=1 Tax=Pelagibius sp. TaxID=1931238 RepID=UPI00260F3D19|nr:hypothetical protein [Pelagibius sp.]
MLLAAYLDGRLDGPEAEALEARMMADPVLLDQLFDLRQALAESPETSLEAPPASMVARAKALRASSQRKSEAQSKSGAERKTAVPPWSGVFAGWLRPAVPAFAVLTVVLACAGAFELGRYQSERILLQEASVQADERGPGPLTFDDFI